MRFAVRDVRELAPDYVLAPERYLLASAASGDSQPAGSVALGELVIERRERIDPRSAEGAVVLDTTHARDGLLDVAGAMRDGAGSKSTKKRAVAGDLIVSRLRPYLRQIALVHPRALALAEGRPLALSTEFYVLAPRDGGDLAFLVPFLLSVALQEELASAQEGGHHPRVPRSSLFALRVPRAVLRARAATSRDLMAALDDAYRASSRLRRLVEGRSRSVR